MLIFIIMLIFSVPIITFGIFVKMGIGHSFINIHFAMSKSEISKTIGNLMIRLGVYLILAGVGFYSKITWMPLVFISLSVLDPIVVLYVNSRKRESASVNTESSRIAMIISITVTVLVFAGIGILFYLGVQDPSVSVSEDVIKIKSMYGLDINFSEITEISLIEENMENIGPGRRVNGFGGVGQSLKGHFSSKERGAYLLFVQYESSPTIWIERSSKEDIYISFKNSGETRSVYNELAAAFSEKIKG